MTDWCTICQSYHEPRPAQECHERVRRRARKVEPTRTLSGAIVHGVLLGVVLGLPVGALTQQPLPFGLTVAVVTIARVVYWRARRRS